MKKGSPFVKSVIGEAHTVAEVANRLYKIRCVTGHGGAREQKVYAEKIGLEEESYGQWERGHGMIQLYAAVVICERVGVSLDYIYRGRPDFLPLELSRALLRAPDRPMRPRRRRGK